MRSRASKTGLHTYCKPCHIEQMRESKRKHHGSERVFLLQHRYGVDEVQLAWLLLQQDRRCAVWRRTRARHLDHDHRTKRGRGALCFNCNGALGRFPDRVELLRNAAEYLEGLTVDEGSDAG